MQDNGKFNEMPSLDKNFRKLLTYSKIMSLTILSIYEKDGYPHQYLIKDLEVPEGVVKPNLEYLEKNRFITKSKESDLIIYRITEKGKEALNSIMSWLDELKGYKSEGLSRGRQD